MPLYVADYLGDTGRLTTEMHGAYLLLIMEYWRAGEPLPDCDMQLASITRLPERQWAKIRPVLARFFTVADGVWQHGRVDEELSKASDRYAKTQARSAAANAAKAARKTTGKASNKDTLKDTGKETSEEPQPQPQSPIGDDDGDDAGAGSGMHDLPIDAPPWKRVLSAIGVLDDPRWLGNASLVTAWLNAGCDLDLDILPTVKAVMAKRGAQGPPANLKYFDRAVMQAKADRLRTLEEQPANARRPAAAARGAAPDPDAQRDADRAAMAAVAARRLAAVGAGS